MSSDRSMCCYVLLLLNCGHIFRGVKQAIICLLATLTDTPDVFLQTPTSDSTLSVLLQDDSFDVSKTKANLEAQTEQLVLLCATLFYAVCWAVNNINTKSGGWPLASTARIQPF
jgi:hypothetical protein